jgi:hypothetical protein
MLNAGEIRLQVHKTVDPNLIVPDGLWQASELATGHCTTADWR